MSRVAVLFDVHGNLPALDAVLAEAAAARVDGIVCGGDVALFGPEPAACVDRLRGAPAVQGNTDRYIAEDVRPPPWGEWPPETIDWYRDVLGEGRLAWLTALPTRVELPGHDALVVHATPRSDEEILRPDTAEDEAVSMVAGVTAATLLAGHVHVQYRRRLGDVEVVNPGSVGLPYDGDPRAAWALLDDGRVELRRTEYDREATVAALEASGNPAAGLTARRLRESRP